MAHSSGLESLRSQDRFLVPPFDVGPGIIAQCTKALLESFDANLTNSAKGSGAGTEINSNGSNLTHQHIAKVFDDVSPVATATYASIMGVQSPNGAISTDDEDTAHRFKYLMPYGWQRLRRALEEGKNAGRSIADMRADIAGTEAYWTNVAYNQIENDLLPFIVRGSKILLLGEGRLVTQVLQTALQYATTASVYVLEGRPELPHEQLNAMLGANSSPQQRAGFGTHGSSMFMSATMSPPTGNGGSFHNAASFNPNSSPAPTEVPNNCCGQRVIDKICARNPQYRDRLRLLPDSSAASVLRDCNFVLLGAYAATKNGGIVHRAGSLQVAMLAKAMNIPVYVLCESYKFSPIYPLSSDSIAQPSLPSGWLRQIQQNNGYAGVSAPPPSMSYNPPIAFGGASSPARHNHSKISSTTSPAQAQPHSHGNFPSVQTSSFSAQPSNPSDTTAAGESLADITSNSGALAGRGDSRPGTQQTLSSYHGHSALEHTGGMLSAGGSTITPPTVPPLPDPHYLEFVPGDLITFFFTDRRILPPSGVVMDIHQTFPLSGAQN
eukprot:GILI01016985.1.p1 GENE.GILI01016985.1~~GILI01016985.1.p1  ORF type:complete len:551 (+),score=86.90 GILI01016985.1:63-1715(+)